MFLTKCCSQPEIETHPCSDAKENLLPGRNISRVKLLLCLVLSLLVPLYRPYSCCDDSVAIHNSRSFVVVEIVIVGAGADAGMAVAVAVAATVAVAVRVGVGVAVDMDQCGCGWG